MRQGFWRVALALVDIGDRHPRAKSSQHASGGRRGAVAHRRMPYVVYSAVKRAAGASISSL